MKIRQGFVSNSSSSSFLCKGFIVDKDIDILNLCIQLEITTRKEFENWCKENYEEYGWDGLEDEYLRENSIIPEEIAVLSNSEEGLPGKIERQDKIIIGVKDWFEYETVWINEEDEKFLSKLKQYLPRNIKEIVLAGDANY